MAKQDELKIRAVLDTSEFDTSLDSMKQEFAALEKKLGSSLLSPQDQKAVLARMGTLKKGIDGLNLQVDALGKQSGFEQLVQVTTPLIGGFTAAASALQLFGVENEKLNEIVQQTQALTIGLLALQDLSNLKNLKGLVALRAEKVKNFVVDKLTFKNTVKQTAADSAGSVAKGVQAAATKVATKAQLAWNAAITANPIGLIIAGVVALAAAIYLLTRAFGDSTKEIDETKRASDGLYIVNEELRASYNDTLFELEKLNLEYQNITGTLGDYEYQLALANLELEKNLDLIESERVKALEKLAEDSVNFWDGLRYNFLNFIGATEKAVEGLLDKVDETEDERNAIIEDANKKREALQLAHNNKLLKLNKDRTKQRIKTEEDLTQKILEEQRKRQELLTTTYEKLLQLRINNLKDGATKEKDQLDLNFGIFKRQLIEQRSETIDEIRKSNAIFADEELFPDEMFIDWKEKLEYLGEDVDVNSFIKIITDAIGEMTDVEREALTERLILIQYFNGQVKFEEEKLVESKKDVDEKYKKEELAAEREHQEKLLDIKLAYARESISTVSRETDRLRGASTQKEFRDRKKAEEDVLKENLTALKEYYVDRINVAKAAGETEEVDLLSLQMENEMDGLQDSFNDRWEGFSADVVSSIADMTGLIAGAVSEIFERDVANKFALLNERLQAEQETAQNSLDALRDANLINEEEYEARSLTIAEEGARKERELKVKQAKAEKRLAIFQILIDTAIAVSKSWAQGGGLLGAPIAAIAAAAGAIQIGLVASQPIPEYAKGGKIRNGRRHAFGGNVINAEEGEFVINRNSVSQPGVESLLNMINRNGNNEGANAYNPSDGSTDANVIQQIVQDTIRGVASIPVVNLESDYTKVQRKVKSIETRASW